MNEYVFVVVIKCLDIKQLMSSLQRFEENYNQALQMMNQCEGNQKVRPMFMPQFANVYTVAQLNNFQSQSETMLKKNIEQYCRKQCAGHDDWLNSCLNFAQGTLDAGKTYVAKVYKEYKVRVDNEEDE